MEPSSAFLSYHPCTVCGEFVAKSYGAVLRHVEEVHQFEPGFEMICGFCPQTFKKVSSCKSHIYRKHRSISSSNEDQEATQMEVDLPAYDDDSEECATPLQESNNVQEQPPAVPSTVDVKNLAAMFILKARDVHMIPQDTIDALLPDVTNLFHVFMASESPSSMPFADLETESLQKAYFKKKFNLLEPEEIVLGCEAYLPGPSGHRDVKHYCYYVSLIQSLKRLLNVPEVYKQIIQSSDGLMRDFCDGETFEKHEIFSSDPHALQIELYYDDVDVCNPIGSKATIHKLGLFYFSLKNIEPAKRSTLDSMWLLVVVKTSYIKKYGINTILRPIVEEIKQLESVSGVEFDINGEKHHLRGALTAVVADNPASCLVGGFKDLSSAFRKCRQCMATDTEVQTQFVEEASTLRTKAGHQRHLTSIRGPAASEASITYGVIQDSVLNELKYFHVTTGLPPDVMHDILEGVAVLNLQCLLEHFIVTKKIFTLAELNDRIKHFPYSFSDTKSKPHPIKSLSKLNQNASQMWCLLRLLPLIIGDKIEEGDEYWDNYLTLLDIVDYAFAPVTSKHTAGHMRHLIGLYLEEFVERYPLQRLTPKFHYLIHLPRWIIQHGPLKNFWAMRYEAKNKYSKKWPKITGNFKNVAKTVSSHHQMRMCYNVMSKNFLKTKISVGPAHEYDLETDVEGYVERLDSYHETVHEIFRVNWVEIAGIRYRESLAVLVEFQYELPVFGRIDAVLKIDGDFRLFLTLYEVSYFDRHLHAYKMKLTSLKHLCPVKCLHDHTTLSIYQSFGFSSKTYIPLKYYIEDCAE